MHILVIFDLSVHASDQACSVNVFVKGSGAISQTRLNAGRGQPKCWLNLRYVYIVWKMDIELRSFLYIGTLGNAIIVDISFTGKRL